VTDRRATFRGLLRLDHLFFRLADGWHGRFVRANERFESDHYPLIGTIQLGGASRAAGCEPPPQPSGGSTPAGVACP
jgi:hypothetical protein